MIQIFCDLEIEVQKKGTNIKTSGMLRSHYSPKTKVVLDSIASVGDGLVALAEIPTPSGCIRLLSPKTIEEFARHFYGALRLGDKKNLNKIVIILPPGEGLAEAIRDRSIKAAARK
jgi:L-threonylcarbamoyladenylate synthase